MFYNRKDETGSIERRKKNSLTCSLTWSMSVLTSSRSEWLEAEGVGVGVGLGLGAFSSRLVLKRGCL